MKSIIGIEKIIVVLFFTSLALILSCSTGPDEKPNIVHPIIGSWHWLESFGGWGQHLTPESEGYEKTVIFQSDHIYKELHDDEEFEVSEFDIENKPAWGTNTPVEDVLIIESHIKEQIIDIQEGDTLHLTEVCDDCGEHYYVRIEGN